MSTQRLKGAEDMSGLPVLRLRPWISPVLGIFGIFVLAVLVRVVYNLTVARDYFPQHDSLTYQTLAFNMLDHHCFCLLQGVTVSRGPLWPFLIAGISLVVGRADLFDRLFLCLLDAGTCVLVYSLVRDLFGRRLGLLAGFFAAIYPALYIYTGWLYTETLSTFLQTAVVYILLRIQRGGDRDWRLWRLWGLCGLLLSLLALTHPNGLLVIGLVALWAVVLVWRRLLPRSTLRGAALAVGLACALIAPWTIRNAVVSHAFVPVAPGTGAVLYGAYNNTIITDPKWLGGWYPLPISGLDNRPPIQIDTCAAPCEVVLDREESAAAIHWAEAHVGELPLLMFYHLQHFLTPYTHEADMPMDRFRGMRSSKLVRAMSDTFPIPVLLLAGLGLVVTLRRNWRELFFAYLVIGGTVAQILVFYGNSRFRTPIEPLLLLLACGAIWWLTDPGPGTLHHWRGLRAKPSAQAAPVVEPVPENGVPLNGTAFPTGRSLPNTLPWRRQQRTGADGVLLGAVSHTGRAVRLSDAPPLRPHARSPYPLLPIQYTLAPVCIGECFWTSTIASATVVWRRLRTAWPPARERDGIYERDSDREMKGYARGRGGRLLV